MIYLDNAATTRTDEIALDCLKRYSVDGFYNPSALYGPAVENLRVLSAARENVLRLLHGEGDFVFTSSGTEADNTVLYGVKRGKRGRIVVSAAEHAAVLNPAADLRNRGADVVFAPVNADGSLDMEAFPALLNEDTVLVSVMHVNNVTGAVNDIGKIAEITKRIAPRALVHSDGVQALGKIRVNLMNLGVDLYSVSAHKVHAPKGVGGLFIKKGVRINPLILGGGQERNMRSATENLAGIAAFSEILSKYLGKLDEDAAKRREVVLRIREGIRTRLPDALIVSPENSPHIVAVALNGIRGEVMVHALEKEGFLVGVGSACGSRKENRYAGLFGLEGPYREGLIRVSVSEENTPDEADALVDALARLSPGLKGIQRL